MTETLYDYPCSETFREHERWWQGEGLYSEPRVIPIESDDYLRERITLLENRLGEIEKTSHNYSYKKRTKYNY